MPVNAQKIRERRLELKLGLSEAAKRAGLKSRQHWYLVETGRAKNPTLDTLERIALVLGFDAADLLLLPSESALKVDPTEPLEAPSTKAWVARVRKLIASDPSALLSVLSSDARAALLAQLASMDMKAPPKRAKTSRGQK